MLEVITGREINDRPDGTDLLVWVNTFSLTSKSINFLC